MISSMGSVTRADCSSSKGGYKVEWVRAVREASVAASSVYRQRPGGQARAARPPLHLGLQHGAGLPTTSLYDARLHAPFDTVLRAQP